MKAYLYEEEAQPIEPIDEHKLAIADEKPAAEKKKKTDDLGNFDFSRYHQKMLESANVRFAKSAEDIKFKEFALIDIDGDGQREVWVRGDEGQDYQGVFSLHGDTVEVLAEADVRSELKFYKGAVGYDGYYGDGRVMRGASMLKNSRCVHDYSEETKFNIFSDEQEMLLESYWVDNKVATAEQCERFREQLGEEVELDPVWHAIR